MSKKRFLLCLPLAILASCGGGTPTSTDSLTPVSSPETVDYFEQYQAASKKTAASDNVGVSMSKGRFYFSFDGKDSSSVVQSGVKKIDFNPLNLNLKAGNIHATDPKQVALSFGLESDAKAVTRITATGFAAALDAFGRSATFAPRGYLEQGTFYGDMSNASFLWMALNLAGRSILEDQSFTIPEKGKATLRDEDLEKVKEYLPIDSYLTDFIDQRVKGMKEDYAEHPNSYAFVPGNGTTKISYTAPSFSDLLDSVIGKAKEAETSSSIDMGPIEEFADKIRNAVTLNKGVVDYVYGDAGLVSTSYEIKMTFDEAKIKEAFADADTYPCDEFYFKGTFNYSQGEDAKPATISSAKKGDYSEYDYDAMKQIIDKIKDNGQNSDSAVDSASQNS